MQNLLEKSVIRGAGSDVQTVSYDYNYFGQRISKKNGLEEVRYLTDITRDHYNLLSQTVSGKTMTFTYDDNVVSFEREGTRNYYQLDELGSTMYLTGTDGAAYSPKAYDPFGNIIDPKTGKRRAGNTGYTKEGKLIQPFAFTGYREEESGLYYAQARSYDPLSGRFTGEDRVRGLATLPDSYNKYIYCFNDPEIYIDKNGLWPSLADIGKGFVDAATGLVTQAKEDPGKFLASVGTGLVVGVATAAVAAACVAAAPAGLATIAVGVVAYGVAGAVTGAVSSYAGQRASKDYDTKGIDKKEILTSAVGGFVGGAIFGGFAGVMANGAASGASALAKGAGKLLKSAGGKITTAFVSGWGAGTAADATGQYLNSNKKGKERFDDINWGHAIGTGILTGGMSVVGYGASRTRLGKGVSNVLQKTIYDPVYNATTSGLRTISAGIRSIITTCSAENASSLVEQGYYQDANGRWHRPNGQFASNEEVGIGKNNASNETNSNSSESSGVKPNKPLCDMTDSELQELGYKRYSDGSIRDSKGHFAGNSGTVPGTPGVDAAEQYLTDNGYKVKGREITVRSADGTARRYDIVVEDGNGNIVGIEVKSGTAVRTDQQVAIDAELNSSGGLDTVGANAKEADVTHIDSTIEVHVDTNGNVIMPSGK